MNGTLKIFGVTPYLEALIQLVTKRSGGSFATLFTNKPRLHL